MQLATLQNPRAEQPSAIAFSHHFKELNMSGVDPAEGVGTAPAFRYAVEDGIPGGKACIHGEVAGGLEVEEPFHDQPFGDWFRARIADAHRL